MPGAGPFLQKNQQSFTGQGMGPLLGMLLFFGFEAEQLQIPTVIYTKIRTGIRNFLFKSE